MDPKKLRRQRPVKSPEKGEKRPKRIQRKRYTNLAHLTGKILKVCGASTVSELDPWPAVADLWFGDRALFYGLMGFGFEQDRWMPEKIAKMRAILVSIQAAKDDGMLSFVGRVETMRSTQRVRMFVQLFLQESESHAEKDEASE